MPADSGARSTFLELTDRLAQGAELPAPARGARVEVAPAMPAAFEPPQLSGTIGTAGVVLISAPAAAGKSTLAGALAASSGGILIDLARENVGGNFVAGALVGTYDAEVGAVIREFAAGRLLLVIDALDEGQLRAGDANFDAFLADLVDFVSGHPTGAVSLILMARSETAELLAMTLEAQALPFSRLSIEYWQREAATRFIDRVLDARSKGKPHRKQREPFERARDLLWDSLETLVARSGPGEAGVEAFLGYPPVLLAVASYLDEDNPHGLEQQMRAAFESEVEARSPWQFVLQIVSDVLAREHDKTIKAIRERLEPGIVDDDWQEWDSLYTSDEQCARLLRWTTGEAVDGEPPSALPQGLGDPYNEAMRNAIPQHAFTGTGREFANAVFRDFVVAAGLSSRDREQREAALALVHVGEELPSPLLGRFMLLAGAGVLGEDVGIIYESLLAQSDAPDSLLLDIAEGSGGDSVFVSVSVRDGAPPLTFEAATLGSPLQFPRRLRGAAISVSGLIRLGQPGRDLLIGPNVDITVGLLECPAGAVTVLTDPDGVVIESDVFDGAPSPPRLVVRGAGGFITSWPDMTYPWVDYRGDADRGSGDPDALDQRFRHVNHILRYFLRHGRGDLRAPVDLVRNVAVGASPEAQAVFERLIERGVISESGGSFVVDTEAMASSGINYSDLRHRKLNPGLVELLRP